MILPTREFGLAPSPPEAAIEGSDLGKPPPAKSTGGLIIAGVLGGGVDSTAGELELDGEDSAGFER
jgi:hypothetical protein